jgi:phosphoserine phosphatase RsbU/P
VVAHLGGAAPLTMPTPAPRLGLFLRGSSYFYQDEVIGGVHQECRARGVNLICLAGGNITTADARNFIYALPGPQDLDAAIIAKGTLGAEDGDPGFRMLLERLRPIPVLTIGAREPGVASVTVDNAIGVRALTRHLIEAHGRRRIAFVAGHGREAERRFAGYRLGHRDCGLVLDERLLIPGDFQIGSGRQAVAALFDGAGPGCDAIVAANDWMAMGVLEALAARGRRVPEDVAVVGFDDVDEARFTVPPLTTVRQVPRQLGVEAVRAVLARGAAGAGASDLVLQTLPQIRQSCGCFRGGQPTEAVSRVPPRPHDTSVWAAAVAASGPMPDPSLPTDWAERMASALRRDLEEGRGDRFLSTVDDVVSKAGEVCNVSAWHQPVATLRREAVRDLGPERTKVLLAETLFERAHLLIGDHAERVQGRRRLESEAMFRALAELGRDLRLARDRAALGQALAAHLPDLRVSSAAIVVHPARRAPVSGDDARVIIAWDGEHGLRTFERGVSFRASQLLPLAFRPAERHTLMVQPLCYEDEALGWCVLEMDPPRTVVCEEIPGQVSAALEATAVRERLAAALSALRDR